MADYSKGKIYKIICDETHDVYIGSTCKTLEIRMEKHKESYKRYLAGKYSRCMSYEIVKYQSSKIILILDFACESKKELERKEGEIMKQTENCINKNIAGRTNVEWIEDNKEYKNQYNKKYQQENKERMKKYREENKEYIKQYKKQYYEQNKERITEKRKLKRAKKRAEKLAEDLAKALQ